MKIGFDSNLYMQKQTEHILARTELFKGKLYLEFGGKLFDDYHAARVLPGFDANAKVKLLRQLKDKCEIIMCINSIDIEKKRIRGDYGITYDLESMRLIDNLRDMGLTVSAIVLTLFDEQPAASAFYKKMKAHGERVYIHRATKGYPTDVATIVSPEGYGANPYIETAQPIVVVTAPGANSGKLATCLSQVYHEHLRGVKAGYAKFETFPIWNLPLKHPVNLAYEAATADLDDVNMIDPFHLEAYGETAVNYNRDIRVFPILKAILSKISQNDIYKSPTDMGVNMAGKCIVDDGAVREAAKQEIIRRRYRYAVESKQGLEHPGTVGKVEMIMSQLDIKNEDRLVVAPALRKEAEKGVPVVSIMLPDGKIVTGKTSELMTAPSSAIINAIKELSGILDNIHLISPNVLEPITRLKKNTLGVKNLALSLDEILIALSICAATNTMAELAVGTLEKLKGCEAHSTCILPETDESVVRKLQINLTCEAVFPMKDLYYK
ncbi:MAG: DUF1846 domain-containing protein, partial [Defluviitaleaceae bacterium]|nr:DUF1846 domain-containing protein [Defluviitaleaceae bacterium]